MSQPTLSRTALSALALAAGIAMPWASVPARAADKPAANVLERGSTEPPSHALSVVLSPAGVLAPGPDAAAPSGWGQTGLWVKLSIDWDGENSGGAEERLSQLDAALNRLEREDAPVVIRIDGNYPREATESAALDVRRGDFLDFLRRVARTAGGRAGWFELANISPVAARDGAAALAAYEVKSASVTIRAESPAAGIAVGVSEDGFELLLAAYTAAGDLDPYVDAISVKLDEAAGAMDRAAAMKLRLLEPDPGASFWVESEAPARLMEPPGRPELLARAAELVAAGADLTAFTLPTDGSGESADGLPPLVGLGELSSLARALGPGLGLSPKQGAGIEPDPDSGIRWTRLFDEQEFAEVIVYWLPAGAAERDELVWTFSSTMRRGYRVLDPLAGQERFLRASEAGEDKVTVVTPAGRSPRLLLVTRRRVTPGVDVEEELADVRAERVITAEEIIAVHQRWKVFQDDRLRTIRRDGKISFRPRFAQFTGTADLTIEGDYYWEPSTGGEWVIREKYINGVRLNWNEVPEVPLINWEQVIQAPLDLDLDKSYGYEYDGEDVVDDRSCWKLRFEPLPGVAQESLFRGDAWIDQRTGALVQVRSVQTGLTAPVLSREERRLFRPYRGPDGTEYWVLDVLDGQILQSVAGRNLVILQEWQFGPPQINDGEFAATRAAAYESRNQMLRDTPEGFRWLTRTEDGKRVVRTEPDTSQWFAAAGVLKDEGLGGVVPLAGVNYVNVDAFDSGILFNMFLAGPIANVTLSDPSLFESKWDVGANLNAVALAGTDRVFEAGDEVESLRVRRLTQSLSLHAGHPIGDFFKLRGGFSVDWIDYRDDDKTEAGFVIPSDHAALTTSLSLAFDRGGWGLSASGQQTVRSSWDAWGAPGELVTGDALESARDFTTWSVTARKSSFFKGFQQFEVEGKWVGGSDLDRFSAFTFGFLSGDRVRGLGGSGIRYDRGLLASVGYEFNLKEIVRFDADVDHARVRELADGRDSSHTGIGFAASFPGPWETLIRLDVGYALKSDVEEVEGDTEFLLVVLRLF